MAAADILENVTYAETSSPLQSAGDLHALEDHKSLPFEAVHVFNNETNGYIDSEGGDNSELLDIGGPKNVESPEVRNALHPHNLDVVKSDRIQKHYPPRDLRVAPGEISQTDHSSCEVLIGSISISVTENCTTQKRHDDGRSESLLESCSIDHVTCRDVGAKTSRQKRIQLKMTQVSPVTDSGDWRMDMRWTLLFKVESWEWAQFLADALFNHQ
ncbi:hypothetical protein POM88_009384 [Heracleum sosnowskyi]|uniref:Uncharacterized protein n=1 Tax=Heracleum sosnowskyi TaxID=360622 RepID=A0AAD8JBD7_9APIA|nr:hypothetical protein POM88_009384 [Heracleum sosnowskyi]